MITNYGTKCLIVNGRLIPVSITLNNGLEISNMGVNKFKSILKKKRDQPNLQIYHVTNINNSEKNTLSSPSTIPGYYLDGKDKITEKYSSVFRDDLPARLPPARDVDHEIKTLDNAEPPHRVLFQLSPSKPLVTKEHITDLLNKKYDQVGPRMELLSSSLNSKGASAK